MQEELLEQTLQNRIVRQFHKSFKVKEFRNWEKIYVSVDIHETMMIPTWTRDKSEVFYPDCLDVMRYLSNRKDVCLILWTSSLKEDITDYKTLFESLGIKFEYVNSNPEVEHVTYANYNDKFYTNVILDDKAGFLPQDWTELKKYFELW